MPIDASIYNAFAPRVQSPLEIQNGLMQQASMASQMQNQQLDMQQKQDAFARAAALRQSVQASGGDRTKLRSAIVDSGDFAALDKHDKTQAAVDKDQAAAVRDKLETFQKTTIEKARQFSAADPNDNNAIANIMADMKKAGLLTDEGLAAEVQKAGEPNTPQRAAWYEQSKQMAQTQVERQHAQLEALKQAEQVRQFGVTSAEAERSHKATNATSLQVAGIHEAGQNKRNAANIEKDYRIQGVDPKTGAYIGATGGDPEQQLNYWAEVVRKGGVLPPGLARGKDGSAFVREVTKRAAMGNTTPADLMANQAEFAGAKSGQRTLGTRQANVEMAATEAYNMIPIALAASNKVDRTRFPNLNSLLLAAEKGTGDENVVQLATATNSLINSYARAISPSGTPTVSDKEHAREILDKAYSKGQYKAATDIMSQEIEAARKSPVQVKEHMRPGAANAPAARTVTRTGVDASGKKVIQYSDGTIEHAN